MNRNIILTSRDIDNKVLRISYQICETFHNENEIVIAGISKNGFVLAKRIQQKLIEISTLKTIICEVIIDKSNPLNPIKTSLKSNEYQDKNLVLIDDVLNSGSTLIYGVKHFLDVPLKKIKTAVLVDRNHKRFPVKADFKGISLSTSSKEHVEVVFTENESYAHLI